jgi:hypothetical protein
MSKTKTHSKTNAGKAASKAASKAAGNKSKFSGRKRKTKAPKTVETKPVEQAPEPKDDGSSSSSSVTVSRSATPEKATKKTKTGKSKTTKKEKGPPETATQWLKDTRYSGPSVAFRETARSMGYSIIKTGDDGKMGYISRTDLVREMILAYETNVSAGVSEADAMAARLPAGCLPVTQSDIDYAHGRTKKAKRKTGGGGGKKGKQKKYYTEDGEEIKRPMTVSQMYRAEIHEDLKAQWEQMSDAEKKAVGMPKPKAKKTADEAEADAESEKKPKKAPEPRLFTWESAKWAEFRDLAKEAETAEEGVEVSDEARAAAEKMATLKAAEKEARAAYDAAKEAAIQREATKAAEDLGEVLEVMTANRDAILGGDTDALDALMRLTAEKAGRLGEYLYKQKQAAEAAAEAEA